MALPHDTNDDTNDEHNDFYYHCSKKASSDTDVLSRQLHLLNSSLETAQKHLLKEK